MDISYYKSMEPFWGVWYIDKELGEGSFGHVFSIKREDYGETYYSALKVISIPNDKKEVNSLKSEGMDDDSIYQYYDSFVSELVKEFSLMVKIKGHSNIVSYEDHMTRKREGQIGYDIFIRMELLTPLDDYIAGIKVTERMVAELGADICKALEICEKHNIIHRDIKPENVFVSKLGTYKLGDFGVSRVASQATQGMSIKGTISYMAPEVYKGQEYNSTVDIYSLGIMMYKLINKNRGPFLPPAPIAMKYADREKAESLRMNGTEFPDAANAGAELMRIIRKAAAYNYKERYRTATEMRKDLESFINSVSDVAYDSQVPVFEKEPGANSLVELDATVSSFNLGKTPSVMEAEAQELLFDSHTVDTKNGESSETLSDKSNALEDDSKDSTISVAGMAAKPEKSYDETLSAFSFEKTRENSFDETLSAFGVKPEPSAKPEAEPAKEAEPDAESINETIGESEEPKVNEPAETSEAEPASETVPVKEEASKDKKKNIKPIIIAAASVAAIAVIAFVIYIVSGNTRETGAGTQTSTVSAPVQSSGNKTETVQKTPDASVKKADAKFLKSNDYYTISDDVLMVPANMWGTGYDKVCKYLDDNGVTYYTWKDGIYPGITIPFDAANEESNQVTMVFYELKAQEYCLSKAGYRSDKAMDVLSKNIKRSHPMWDDCWYVEKLSSGKGLWFEFYEEDGYVWQTLDAIDSYNWFNFDDIIAVNPVLFGQGSDVIYNIFSSYGTLYSGTSRSTVTGANKLISSNDDFCVFKLGNNEKEVYLDFKNGVLYRMRLKTPYSGSYKDILARAKQHFNSNGTTGDGCTYFGYYNYTVAIFENGEQWMYY